MRHLAAAMAALLAVSIILANVSEAEGALSDHHEHPGVTDASAGAVGHAHGDADDHHETPGSPCHHHVIHCYCNHMAEFICEARAEDVSLVLCRPTGSYADFQHSNLDIRQFFHVPIA